MWMTYLVIQVLLFIAISQCEAASLPCPLSYPATFEIPVDGTNYSLSDCDLGDLTVLSIVAGVPATSGSVTSVVIGKNTVRGTLLLISKLSDAEVNTLDNSAATLRISFEDNKAAMNASTGSVMQLTIAGSFLSRTDISVAGTDFREYLGNASFSAMLANSVPLPTTSAATFSTPNYLSGIRGQALRAIGQGVSPSQLPSSVPAVLSPYLFYNLRLSGSSNLTIGRASSNNSAEKVLIDTDPITLVASASAGEIVTFAFLSVYGTVTVTNGARISISNNAIQLSPTIDASKSRSLSITLCFVYVYASSTLTASYSSQFAIVGNNYSTSFEGGVYALDDSTNSITASTPPATIGGLEDSVVCFTYLPQGASLEASHAIDSSLGAPGGTITLTHNAIAINAGLPLNLLALQRRFPSIITFSTYLQRVGFIEGVSGTPTSRGMPPQIRATDLGIVTASNNSITVTGAHNVTGAVGGLGAIPCDALPVNSFTRCYNQRSLTLRVNEGGSLVLNFNVISIVSLLYLYPSQAATSNAAVGTSLAAIYIPASAIVDSRSLLSIIGNDITVRTPMFPNTAAWNAASEAARSVVRRGAPFDSFATYAHSIFTHGVTIGPSFLLQGSSTILAVLSNTIRYTGNGIDGTVSFVHALAEPGSAGDRLTAMSINTASSAQFVFGDNTAQNSEMVISDGDTTRDRPALLGGEIVGINSGSGGLIGACFDASDTTSYFGIAPSTLVIANGSVVNQSYPSIQLGTNGDSRGSVPTVAVRPDYCSLSGAENATVPVVAAAELETEHEREMRKIINGVMGAAVISLLFVGTFFGAPVTEVQCCIMMFMSSCASHSNYLSMDVARHFLSPLQSVSTIGALAFNVGAIGLVWILWAVLITVFMKFIQKEGYYRATKVLAFPGAPLLITRVLLPGVWFNAFANIDDNKAALWVGVVVGGLVFFGNAIMIYRETDMHFADALDDVLYNFFLPDHTSDIARSYFHVAGPGVRGVVMMYWVTMPIFVAGLVSASATKNGDKCDLPMGFLVAILWLFAILFIVFRPHGSAFRSFVYAALEFIVGCIALVILVEDSTAQATFVCFLIIFVFILLLHTIIQWIYVFCYRNGASKGTSPSVSKAEEGGTAGLKSKKGEHTDNHRVGQGPEGIRSVNDELDAERARERNAIIAENREYDRMNIAYAGKGGDNAEGRGALADSDSVLAARYNAMLSAVAKGQEDPEAKKRKELQQQLAAKNDKGDTTGPAGGSRQPTPPPEATATMTAPAATTTAPQPAVDGSTTTMFSSLGSPNPMVPAATIPTTTADNNTVPAYANYLNAPTGDDDDLDPREKRRRKMEMESEGYPY